MGAKKGDVLQVHYTGTLADGTEFDSSRDREPLEFVLGGGMLIPGFDRAVEGREVGDSFSFTIPADQAYGPAREDMRVAVARNEIPEHIIPEVGMVLQLTTDGATPEVDAMITKVTDEVVLLDANHPLAGKDLTFAVEILSITPA